MYLFYFHRIPLPSILGRRRRVSKCVGPKAKAPKVITWDRTIVCLPSCYVESLKSSDIPIPRKKWAANGLIGKIHLESDWTEEEVFAEIRSVFSSAMGDDSTFPLQFYYQQALARKLWLFHLFPAPISGLLRKLPGEQIAQSTFLLRIN